MNLTKNDILNYLSNQISNQVEPKKMTCLVKNDQWFSNQIEHPMLVNRSSQLTKLSKLGR